MNNELNNDAALSKYDAAFDIFNVGHLWLEKYLFVIIFTIRAKNTIRFRWNGPGISLQKSLRALRSFCPVAIPKIVSQFVIKGKCEFFLPNGEKLKKINESSMMTHHVLKEHCITVYYSDCNLIMNTWRSNLRCNLYDKSHIREDREIKHFACERDLFLHEIPQDWMDRSMFYTWFFVNK